MTATTTIEDLAARVASLEAERCNCTSCQQRSYDRRMRADADRRASVYALGDEACLADLVALPLMERSATIKLCPHDRFVALYTAATAEQRTSIARACPDGRVPDSVVVECLDVPRYLRIEFDSRHLWRSPVIPIDEDTAAHLASIGLGDRITTRQTGDNANMRRPALIAISSARGDMMAPNPPLTLRGDQYDAMCALDLAFVAMVAKGFAEVSDLPVEECRRLLRVEWQAVRERERAARETTRYPSYSASR